MARFQSHSLTLFRQIFSPLLLLIIFLIITIHPSYGDELQGPPMPMVVSINLVSLVCNHTSERKFCVDNISKSILSTPLTKASDIANCALLSAKDRADDAQRLLDGLFHISSAKKCQLLRRCRHLNNEAIRYLSSAQDNLNYNFIDSMVEDLNDASNAMKRCQDIILGIPSFSELADKNSDVIKFCEISIASTRYFP
ncbi:hypothetical protein DITRI_Ditri06bG0081700 [Diplodiscus trichospermus]